MKNNVLKFLIIAVVISFISKNALAQDDYEKWLKKENKRISTYISNEDKVFANFLEKEWKQFKLSQGFKFDNKPKPQNIPKLDIPEDIVIEAEFKDLPAIKVPVQKVETKPRQEVIKDVIL